MRPLRTALTTAALRRTTQRVVFGGGRSSLIDGTFSGCRSSALFTGSRQDRGGPERPAPPHGLPLAGLVALRHIAPQRDPVGGGGSGLGRQRAGGQTAGNSVIADKGGDCRHMFFAMHR